MPRRTALTLSFAMIACLAACVPDWPLPALGDCLDDDCTGSSGAASSSGPTSAPPLATTDGPSTGGGDADMTGGDTQDASSGEDAGTTGMPESPPAIGPHAITPDYIATNTVLGVTASAAEGTVVDKIQMRLDGGEPIELEQIAPGEFVGEIAAYTALKGEHGGNGEHTATLTPWRGAIEGEAVTVDYVIALPPPGYERHWSVGGQSGSVAAIDLLPDGRPVEFGTVIEDGEPRCYLNLRNLDGSLVESLTVLPTAYCRATDMTTDSETGMIFVLMDRKGGNGDVWWAGAIAGWGNGPVNIGTGAVGETALALAHHPEKKTLAVCGSQTNADFDGRDALAVLLRPGEQAEPRLLDYRAEGEQGHKFAEVARDCKFSVAGDTLVLVGEAWGYHDDINDIKRDRLALVEVDVLTDDDPKWTVAGPGPGTQSRGLALDIDDLGRAHVVGYTCSDDCKPDGEVRVYEPGGALASPPVQLGPLGSLWLGPHDIAWSPAGYAVVAFGELEDGESVFKAQAVAPGGAAPLWTFLPLDRKGQQLALAATVGPNGEVYLGGIADGHPAFAVSGG
ncbi:MAG: hypothetical protein JNL82_40295 [Myxococcales bacterium]|nr:hypothetical protein [Myxococcales bacterium]